MKREKLLGIMKLALLAVVFLALSGCAGTTGAFDPAQISAAFTERQKKNNDLAKQLNEVGVLTDSDYQKILETIAKNTEGYRETFATDQNKQKALLSAASAWYAPGWLYDHTEMRDGVPVEVNALGFTEEEWKEAIITTNLGNNQAQLVAKYVPSIKSSQHTKEPTPIVLIDDDILTMINKALSYQIWALDVKSTGGTSEGLDEVVAAVQAVAGGANPNILSKYFSDTGETMLDYTQRDYQAVVTSEGIAHTEDWILEDSTLAAPKIGRWQNGGAIPYENEPGKDMIITQIVGGVPFDIMSLRLVEFNEQAIKKIIDQFGMNKDKYMYANSRLYVMEYPVHIIDEMSIDSEKFKTTFKESDMGINLMTGNVVKYHEQDYNSLGRNGTVIEDNNPYLTLTPAQGQNEEYKMSFCFDTALEKHKMTVRPGVEIESNAVILRDYLEGTFSPNVVSGEKLVVYGRKVRIQEFFGNRDDVVGVFYDIEGNHLVQTGNSERKIELYIDDFMDFAEILKTPPTVKYIPVTREKLDEEDTATPTDEVPEEFETSVVETNNISNVDHQSASNIKPVFRFPGQEIGIADYNLTDSRPIFYGIAVARNMFDSSLFSGWIYNTDTSKNSLPWWRSWMEARGMQYNINENSLSDFLMGNYSFQLSEEGIIVLNLETIARIQKEYTKENDIARTRWIRTIFVILGTTLIVYSLCAILCWTIDINMDAGMELLRKISFGHWISVRDSEETPDIDTEDRTYMDFKKLSIRMVIFILVGVMLITVNIVELVLRVIEMFGGFALLMDEVLKGMR